MFDCKLTVYVLIEGWRDARGCVMCQGFVLGFVWCNWLEMCVMRFL